MANERREKQRREPERKGERGVERTRRPGEQPDWGGERELQEIIAAGTSLRYTTPRRQALVQRKSAPDVAGESRLASALRRHLEETERQAEMIEKRLEVLGGKPKRVKDAIMALGVTPPPAAGGRAPGAGTMFAT